MGVHKRYKFNWDEKYNILNRYLIKGELVVDIYKEYQTKNIPLSSFQKYVSGFVIDKKLVKSVLIDKKKTTIIEEQTRKKNVIITKPLGNKTEPYFKDYDESIFKPALYQKLSLSEQLIFDA